VTFDIAKHAHCQYGNCLAFPDSEYPPDPDDHVVMRQCEIRQELTKMARQANLLPGHCDTVWKAIARIDNLTENYLEAVAFNRSAQ
jgi:hypothetical protein